MRLITTTLFALIFLQIFAQISRYPYIQSTTQSSTIIAWKTDANATGKVAYGLSATNLTDTVYENTNSKRHDYK